MVLAQGNNSEIILRTKPFRAFFKKDIYTFTYLGQCKKLFWKV